jgi:taurine dioxygenase
MIEDRQRSSAPLDVRPTTGGLGAEVRDIDLRTLSDDNFAAIHAAWLQNLVLLFRNQDLTPADLIAFSRRLGALDHAPIQETGRRVVGGMPELYVVSNVVENGEPIGSLGSGEAVWHTDMSYVEQAPQGERALRARGSTHGREHQLHQHVRAVRLASRSPEAADRRSPRKA